MSVKFRWYWDKELPKVKTLRDRALVAAADAFRGQAKLIVPKKTHNLERHIGVSPIYENSIYVGTNVEYAPYVEYGTRYKGPRSFFRASIDIMKVPLRQIFIKYLSRI